MLCFVGVLYSIGDTRHIRKEERYEFLKYFLKPVAYILSVLMNTLKYTHYRGGGIFFELARDKKIRAPLQIIAKFVCKLHHQK